LYAPIGIVSRLCTFFRNDEPRRRASVEFGERTAWGEESFAGYRPYLELREFGASICFYWNMAGLLDRNEWAAIHILQKIKLRDLNGAKDAVMVLPFSRLIADWKFLKGHEHSYAPASVFLAKKFVAEARDIALDERRGEELFDQTELMIGLEFAYQRLHSGSGAGMPVGQFIWKGRGQWLEEELERIEGLSNEDPFFKAGMIGGGKESAAATIKEIRRWLQQTGLGF
jgi:hypothetical protein